MDLADARTAGATSCTPTAPGLVNRHYHPQQVFAYTISGKWGYLEHDWVATAGDFVYEAPGEAHTLVAYEHDEPMKVHFNVTGPLIWLDENGEPDGHFDVFDYIELCRGALRAVGIGADYVDDAVPLIRVDFALEQGERGPLGVADRGDAADRGVHRAGDHRTAGLADRLDRPVDLLGGEVDEPVGRLAVLRGRMPPFNAPLFLMIP